MNQRITIIAALAVGLVCGLTACRSSGPEEAGDQVQALRSEVAKVVTEDPRRDAMLAAVDRMEDALTDLGELVERHRLSLSEQIRDYDTSRQEMEASFASYLTERKTVIDRLTAAHFEFKAQARPEEWRRLAKKEKTAMTWAADRHLGQVPLIED